jgi:hypothetical protein
MAPGWPKSQAAILPEQRHEEITIAATRARAEQMRAADQQGPKKARRPLPFRKLHP